MKFQKGFTLIEILITISIIAVAFGVVLTSANYLQKSARDAQREADLVNIQSALQQYYADQQYFPQSDPTLPNTLNLSSDLVVDSNTGNPQTPPSVNIYLKTIPKDPTLSQNYYYKAFISSNLGDTNICDNLTTTKCQFYIVCALMENLPSTVDNDCGSPYNYKLTPR